MCKKTWKKTTKRFGGKKGTEARVQATPAFCEQIKSAFSLNRAPIVSVDECYFSEKVLPLYGYGNIGEKLVVNSPVASWKKRSLLLAVGSDGSFEYVVHDGSINKSRFQDFITNLPYPKDSTLILDNVAFHKDTTIMIAKDYRATFSPPYSPEHNSPVENSFSMIKSSFRASWPWSAGVDQSIHNAVQNLDSKHIVNCFKKLREFVSK